MAKISSLMKAIIIICTLILLRYHFLIPGGNNLGGSTQRGVVAIMGALLSACVLCGSAGKKIRKESRWLYRYLIPYGIAIFVSVLYSWWIRGYSFYSLMSGVIPFLLVLFAIPLIYIFKCDGGYLKFVKTIATLEIVILVCKTLGWYFYNFGGPRFFEALTLEFDNWMRGGLQRVEPGQLFALTLIFVLYQGFKNGLKVWNLLLVIFMMAFLVIICQFRFQIAVSAATIIIMLYFMYQKKTAKLWMRLLLILSVAGILISGIVAQVLSSASLTGIYGASTLARINTIEHYFDIMAEQKAFLGLGILDSRDPGAYSIMRMNQVRLYYLDDIGILGGIVRFGFLALIVYGHLFLITLRTCYRCYRYKNMEQLPFLLGVSGYMIMSCILLNIYDWQRAYAVPFYLAIISYIDGQLKGDCGEKKSSA